jgi:FMN phosphatase YigB (HAD superfamily)
VNQEIETIFLDTGNTLRIKVEDPVLQAHVRQELARLVGAKEDPEVFFQRILERHDAYKLLAKGTLLQVTELELWARWLLPDYPSDTIIPVVSELTRLWHNRNGRVIPRPEAKAVVQELGQRGYHLGVIANALSETEIPKWLEADGLAPYFKTVVLSSKFGRRKPDRHIFMEAAYLAHTRPQHCVYVGDNPNRDVHGAQEAGFGMTIILVEQATQKKEPDEHRYKPDVTIHKLTELLSLFPQRELA